jgi:hypothetical protein
MFENDTNNPEFKCRKKLKAEETRGNSTLFGPELLVFSFFIREVNNKVCGTAILTHVFAKLGLSHGGENMGWRISRTRCGVRCFLRGRK